MKKRGVDEKRGDVEGDVEGDVDGDVATCKADGRMGHITSKMQKLS